MSEKSHALNSEMISELLTLREMKIKRPVLELFLRDIIATGRVKEEKGYYELLIEARIYEFFEKNKNQILTVNKIIENIRIARIDSDSTSIDERRNKVEKILNSFVKNGILVKVNSEGTRKWTWGKNLSEKERKLKNVRLTEAEELRYTIHSETLSILKQNRTMEYNKLENEIDKIICKLGFSFSGIDLKKKISETLSEMITNEEMYSDGYMVKYSEVIE